MFIFKMGPERLGVRHFQVFLVFSSIVIFHSIRSSISVIILAMTDNNIDNQTHIYPEWRHVDTILSAYYIGYAVPGTGQIIKHFGYRRIFLLISLIGAIAEILVPVMADVFGEIGVFICFLTHGITQAFILPLIHFILSRWIPLCERATIANILFGASAFATLLSLPISGALCTSPVGWPGVVYLYGSLLVLWSVIWFLFGAEVPSTCKYISKEELLYLETNCTSNNLDSKSIAIPWKSLLTSVPVWAIIIAHSGSNWGIFTLLTYIPSYMNHVLKYGIETVGVLSAIPYVVLWILTFVSGPSADKLINHKILSVGTVRKIYNTISFCVPFCALLILGFMDNPEPRLGISLLILAVSFFAFSASGFFVNPADLSPNYSIIISGISGCVASFTAIFSPLTVQYLGNDKEDPVLWRKLFCVTAGVYFVSGLIYLVLSSGKVQVWDKFQGAKKTACDDPEIV